MRLSNLPLAAALFALSPGLTTPPASSLAIPAGTALLGFATPIESLPAEPGPAEDKKKKKKKKTRGKVVTATVVDSAPAPSEVAEPAAPSPAKKPPAPRAEPAKDTTTAAEPEVATPAANTVPRSAAATPVVIAAPAAIKEPAHEPSAAATPAPAPASAAPATTATAVRPVVPRSVEPRPADLRPADPPRSADRPKPAPPSPDTFRERIAVREVLLDVLVTDKKGNVVEGLGPEDFVVIEDGDEREVTAVTFYGTQAELSGAGIGGTARTDRYFILLFHDQSTGTPELLPAQRDLAKYSTDWLAELQPNDQVAVLAYDFRLKLYQDFTRDPALLAQAIEAAAFSRKDLDLYKTRSGPQFDPNSPSLFVNLPTGKELARRTRKIQEALTLLGEAAEGIVGRKNLLFFSLGYGDIGTQFLRWTPDPRYYPPMKQALNNGNVAVYSIDSLGARRGDPASSLINDSLSSISHDTGGEYLYNFITPIAPLRKVASDNLGYYLISFKTEHPGNESGYQEVDISTLDRNLKVRARKGYRFGDKPGR